MLSILPHFALVHSYDIRPGERIYLHEVRHRCRERWRRTTLPQYEVRDICVSFGQLDHERWYVDVIRLGGDQCRPHPDEAGARQVAEQWMRHLGGEWERIPCDGGIPPGWVGERITVT